MSPAASRPINGTSNDLNCDAVGDTATIKFVGPAESPPTSDPIELYVLVEDKAGNLSFYATGDQWQIEDAVVGEVTRRKGRFYIDENITATEAKPTRYFEHNVMVPRAQRSGGRFVRQSTTLSVKGEGTVHVYLPGAYDADIVGRFCKR